MRRCVPALHQLGCCLWLCSVAFLFTLTLACGGSGNGGNSAGTGGTGGGGGGGGGGTPAPQIQRVEPSRVMVGVPQGSVTLAGSGFTNSSTVLFDGAAVATFDQGSSSLNFEVPTSAFEVAQVHTVQVSNSSLVSNVATYEVYAPQQGPDVFRGQLTQYISESLFTQSLVPDINGDGRDDLVLLNAPQGSSPTLVARYGQTNGLFSAETSLGSFSLQVPPAAILAADFNGDGHTDLVVLGLSAYQVLLNDGTGRFSSAGAVPLPNGCSATAAVGDFNHDGKADFICRTNSGMQPFSILFGNGDGTFSAPVLVGTSGTNPGGIAIAADFNHDGYSDLLYMALLSSGQTELRILLSVGDGTYTDVAASGLPSGVLAFTVGDFNNDHTPDIFAVKSGGLGQAYLGNGNGTFTATGVPIFVYDGFLTNPPFVAGDFDHDGNCDVATRSTSAGPDELVFFFGDGAGNFTPQAIVSDDSFTLQVGDVNGDGIADVFAGTTPGFGYPSTTLGRNDRSFPSPQILLPQNLGVLSTGNVFNSGFTDLLVGGTDGNGDPAVPGTLYQYRSNGTFGSGGQAPEYSTQLVDLNGDGIADMVGTSGSTLLIWQGDGSGVFQSPINQIALPGASSPIYFRDMDGDGLMDIVVPGAIFFGKGNFQFDVLPMQIPQNFLLGDFDGDGIPDIATSSGVFFGQGHRQFTTPTVATPLPNGLPPFATQVAADINGDGMDDIVVTDSSYIVIYLSLGRQGFVEDQQLILYGYYPTVSSLAVADFNGDGLADIAAGLLAGDDLVLFTNDGHGKYQTTSYAIGVYGVMSVAADLNNDGKPDLAFLNYGFDFKPPTVTVLLHR